MRLSNRKQKKSVKKKAVDNSVAQANENTSDLRKTIWKELIEETKRKLMKYPVHIGMIYDKDQSLRIDYSWVNKECDYSPEVDIEIEKILLNAEMESEDLYLKEKNKDKPPKKETFTFGKEKTFFGLTIHAYGIKESDIKELPFYDFWEESARGSTCAVFNNETFVYVHDWERFCYSFVLHGKHRNMP